MNGQEAAREVAWIARRTRELALSPTPSAPAEWLEFYERKAALWRHIGESGLSPSYDPAMLDEAEANARAWRVIVEDEARRQTRDDDDEAEDGCEGHESLAGEHMGVTVFCDGSCQSVRAVDEDRPARKGGQ